MFHQIYRSIIFRAEHVNLEQVTILVVVIVAIGFFCMRGFGSRSNY